VNETYRFWLPGCMRQSSKRSGRRRRRKVRCWRRSRSPGGPRSTVSFAKESIAVLHTTNHDDEEDQEESVVLLLLSQKCENVEHDRNSTGLEIFGTIHEKIRGRISVYSILTTAGP
jgi:hypothetical protein